MRRFIAYLPSMVFLVMSLVLGWRLVFPPMPTATPTPLMGKTVPHFSLPMLDGKGEFTPELWKGKPVLLNVFASWCQPCIGEMPVLREAAEKHGVAIYGIAWHDTDEKSKIFLEQLGNPYRAVGSDSEGITTIPLALTGVPETYVINAEGKVIYKFRGMLERRVLEQSILPLLEKKDAP